MLGGIAPILIFHFPLVPRRPDYNAINGLPTTLSDEERQAQTEALKLNSDGRTILEKNVGVPIPIYLDERLFGICVDQESKAIDIDTESKQRYDGQPPDVSQRGLNSIVSINLRARADSIFLVSLLALCEMAFQRLVSQEYSITYLNGTTTIFNGLLHGLSTNVGEDDNLVRIVLQLSKANGNTTVPHGQVTELSKQTAGIPNVVTP